MKEYDINDEIMDIVDSLGSLYEDVDDKAFEHLLIYIPTKIILKHLLNKYIMYPLKYTYQDIKINFKYYLFNKGI